MAKIFISYRRDDSEYQTDRLHRELKQYVQNPREDIFIDVDNIPFGVDFVEHLQSKVSQCEMLLAVIGKGWLNHTNAKTGTRSLDEPSDFVRIEIATALSRGIPVVPVLLDGTPVPSPDTLPDDIKELARRNGKFINRMSFDADVKSLVQGLPIRPHQVVPDLYDEGIAAPANSTTKDKRRGNGALIGGLIFGALAISAVAVFVMDPMNWRTPLISEPPVSEPFAMIDPGLEVPSEPNTAAPSETITALPNSDANENGATIPDPRPEALRKLQASLRDLGYYSSTIDGEIGPGTRSAISRFSSQFGGPSLDLGSASASEIEEFTSRVNTAIWGEEEAWRSAMNSNSLEDLERFLAKFPKGNNSTAAKDRIEALSPPPEPTFTAGQTFRDTLSGGGQGPEMVVIPSGSFRMGSPSSEAGRGSDEGPQRTVRINYSFAVGKFEVTWAEWEACVADAGCNGSGPQGADGDNDWGKGNRPVISVDWNDAQAYVQWLSRKTGERYRLLSEAEWEYATRAGSTGAYFWGEDASDACAYMNSADVTDGGSDGSWAKFVCDDGYLNTAPVGSYRANAFGLYDLTGNVSEWMQDCYVKSYSGAPTDGSAHLADECSYRVLRGGSWLDVATIIRSAKRFRKNPAVRGSVTGFRVARTL